MTRSELERLGFANLAFTVGERVPEWIAHADPSVAMTWALAVEVYRREGTRPLVFPAAPIALDATDEVPIPRRTSLLQRLKESVSNASGSPTRGPRLALTRTALAPFVAIELTGRETNGVVLDSAVWNYEPLNTGDRRKAN